MAVVFISPKQRQKVFFTGITVMFLLFLSIIALSVFLSKPKESVPTIIFNKTKINIKTEVFDSDQFKTLQPFMEMNIFYSYKAITKTKQPRGGFISAVSQNEARTKLEGSGLTVVEIKEAEIGRDNPFTPYYEVLVKQPGVK